MVRAVFHCQRPRFTKRNVGHPLATWTPVHEAHTPDGPSRCATIRSIWESDCRSSSQISRRWNMNRLGRLLVLTGVILVLGLYVTQAGFAQEKGSGAKATVTGCLQKGDEANEFSITGEDGKTYGLRSSSVDLAKHLGHKVTVTGTLKAESAEKEKN